MSQSLTELYIHLVFSTKYRRPSISQAIEPELHAYIAEILASECRSPPRSIGGYDDHIHVLFNLSRIWSIADVVKVIKSKSSKWIKTKGHQFKDFYWQSGYGAFSVSSSVLPKVEQCIENQRSHHQTQSFQEEFRRLLEKHGLTYDERYAWD